MISNESGSDSVAHGRGKAGRLKEKILEINPVLEVDRAPRSVEKRTAAMISPGSQRFKAS